MSRMSALRDSAARSSAACARSASAVSVAEAAAALFERGARPLQLRQRALARGHAIGVQLRQRAQDARGLSDLADVGGGQQEPEVTALSHLVDVDEPGAQLRAARGFLLLEVVHPLPVRGELAGNLRAVRGELPELFGLDLTIDFQLSQIAEQRALVGRETVGFLLQRLQPIGRALRQRLGARAVGRLRLQRERHDRQGGSEHKYTHRLTYRHAAVSQQLRRVVDMG